MNVNSGNVFTFRWVYVYESVCVCVSGNHDNNVDDEDVSYHCLFINLVFEIIIHACCEYYLHLWKGLLVVQFRYHVNFHALHFNPHFILMFFCFLRLLLLCLVGVITKLWCNFQKTLTNVEWGFKSYHLLVREYFAQWLIGSEK